MACRVASAVADVLSEGESTLADSVVLRPGERDRDYCDDDDVVERRRGAVSAGSWYVRADNAIRMGGADVVVCVRAARGAVECGLGESQTRVVARRAAGAGCCRRWRAAESGGMATSIFTLYRRRKVRLYTDNGSGGRRGLKCA